MGTERVDKNWQQRELDQFSTDAILGTLAHYGVQTDEKAFVELAQRTYPIGIAHLWHEGWRGKAQFGNEILDVVTEGDLIEKGSPVRVIGSSGHEAVVAPV